MQQQQELIEDEAEQEQEETEAREQAKREKKEREERERLSRLEEEARLAKDMLPGGEVSRRDLSPGAVSVETHGSTDHADLFAPSQLSEPAATAAAEKDGRMTKEQLGELAEALSILSAKSSIVKERDELKQLMSDNIASEEVGFDAASLGTSGNLADDTRERCRNPSSSRSTRRPRKSRSTSVSER